MDSGGWSLVAAVRFITATISLCPSHTTAERNGKGDMMTATETPKMHEYHDLKTGGVLRYPAYDVNQRTDQWVEAFDGHYRFALNLPQADELEKKLGRGIFSIYGTIMRGRYEQADGKALSFAAEGAASLADCHETVRLALVGGNMAVVGGQLVKVPPALALRLVQNYLVPAPAVDAWNLAAIVLDAFINGRRARPEEEGSRDPVAPAGTIESAG